MPTQTTLQQEKNTLITDPGRRRSMRVLLSVPIVVTGKDAEEKGFTEEARTLVVNAHGALIALATKVVANQIIGIANKATRQSLDCRVVHVGNAQGGKMQLGVEFVKPSPTFWQIDFPPDDWVVPED
ncbi:MAG TPA: PilZ domain-containing protein [Candidatus Acidoferrales bacterium]|nr:PilZ domain-containing protein [Candidatus Acidoferrales bacterium]